MSITRMNKSVISMFLTGGLLMMAIVFIYFPGINRGANLWIDVLFFSLLNVGLITSLLIALKGKNKSIVLITILVNSALLLIGLLMIFMYLFVIIVV